MLFGTAAAMAGWLAAALEWRVSWLVAGLAAGDLAGWLGTGCLAWLPWLAGLLS